MKQTLMFKILILSFLIIVSSIETKAQKIEGKDSTDVNEMLSGVMNRLDIYNTKWLTIGVQHDFISSTFGLQISNGYDERPLIHFEDFSEDFVFKLQGNTDFNKDYSYGISAGWKYPRYLSLLAVEFYKYNYPTRDFDFINFNISAETFIKNTGIIAKLKLGYHDLNNENNIGLELGLSNIFIYQKLYAGLTTGYYFDYFTYSAFIKSFVYKKLVGIEFGYENIDKYDFLKAGLTFTFKR